MFPESKLNYFKPRFSILFFQVFLLALLLVVAAMTAVEAKPQLLGLPLNGGLGLPLNRGLPFPQGLLGILALDLRV